MKRICFAITTLIMTVLLSLACSKEKLEIHIEVEIDNQSSSQVAGALLSELEWQGFDLAPGESYLFYFVTDSDSKGLAPTFRIGPTKLVIDGKTYIFKSTDKAKDFFDLYGWEITPTTGGFSYKVTLTDEGVARLIANADHSNH